ncbi:NSFL1 cofactor p47 [Porphyridium purpureum]|uniref:NSFL1 cofactor p47 n=1 Tax=Porphyridium purpureum TaxID=35688 RepID=A0A5J4YJ40_PORPP|nr:NSFL1 cofactor p47 [Porphyridium purpureum]|eukprot:POR4324..scf291_13
MRCVCWRLWERGKKAQRAWCVVGRVAMADQGQDPARVDKVVQFMSVTGADVSTANFFLESAAWDVSAAVAAFLDHGAAGDAPGSGAGPTAAPRASAGVAAPAATPAPSNQAERSAATSAAGKSRFATLADVMARNEDDEEDDDEPQGYYAGGEKSGQMIQDPRDIDRRRGEKQRRERAAAAGERTDISESIMERARQMASQMDTELQKARDNQKFVGAGYRLGDEAGASDQAQAPSQPAALGRKLITKRLVFYQNGFVIEGPNAVLRAYDDPSNAEFLHDVERGFVPREMESDEVAQVDIELENRRNEEYVPPKPQVVPFSGSGMRLRDASSSTVAAVTAPTASAASGSNARAPSVDEQLPVYSVQVRLADGRRLVARLNESHTIADLRAFVNTSDPASSAHAYDLALTFPKKVLADTSKTLKDEGLKGAVVVQTMR